MPPSVVGRRSASRTVAAGRDRAPTRRRRKEARPQELLDAALALFVDKGFAATRTEEVAQRAGVSKGTLYLYYPSKAELFKAVVRRTLTHLIAEGQEAVAQYQGSSSDLIAALMNAWWERVGCTPAAGIHKVILAEVRNFPELAQFYADEVLAPADRLFSSAVRRGIERGEFRALPLHAAAHALMAPVMFMTLHQHSIGACHVHGAQPPDARALMRTHLDLVLRGLEVRAAAGARTSAPARAGARP
ncbi:MAG: TetR/AcrR family transcriptional regulator [Burkholderiales bacterium]|nr:TetR/AcrR family transcriptional regulator [Burkholderiales bacterium]